MPSHTVRRVSRRAFLGLMGGLGLGALEELLGRTGDRGGPVPQAHYPLLHGLLPTPTGLMSASRAKVAVGYVPNPTGYSSSPPFDPQERYPEYPFHEQLSGQPNEGYALLREALRAWSPEGFESTDWNPLSTVIKPGDTVAVKPNLVWEPGWDARKLGLTTVHPSTIRAVLDYVYKACGPKGRIVVCEGTATASAWADVSRIAGLPELIDHLRRHHGVPVELVNLNDVPKDRALLVRLGAHSMLAPLVGRTLFDLHNQPSSYIALYGIGSYYAAPVPLQADTVVSLAKMKVHRATGVSLAMKNILGIVPSWDGPYGDDRLKDVPHYSDREAAGGARTLYLENDTTWRSVVDLNRILLYCDPQGSVHQKRQRGYLAIIDGLIAAGRDMFDPEPVPLGVLVVANEAVSADSVAARVMGFDPRLVRSISWARCPQQLDLGPPDPAAIDLTVSGAESLAIGSNGRQTVVPEMMAYPWRGHIETNDFSPPDVVRAEITGTEVRVILSDRSGVSYARLACEADGSQLRVDLRLVGGDPTEGEWRASLPLQLLLRGPLILETADALFNARRYPITR